MRLNDAITGIGSRNSDRLLFMRDDYVMQPCGRAFVTCVLQLYYINFTDCCC